jgi:predicted transposase YbfD/YdcC
MGLLLLVAVGLLAGANSQRALARFGQLHQPWVRRLGFRTPPSQPTLGRLLSARHGEQIQTILHAWLRQVEAAWRTRTRRSAPRWVDGIAIDGKTLRGARRLGAAVHLVSAYGTSPAGPGVVLGQVAVAEGTNELGAALPLLAELALQHRAVTFDAAFTQWAVAEQVLRQGGAYLMVVKGNQPTLKADIAEALTHRSRWTGQAETVRAGHGRIERRRLVVAPATAVRDHVLGWPGAQQILALTRHVVHKRTGQVHEETVYAVTSLRAEQADAPALLRLWQQHWGIENQVHWVRDVVFGEDQSTTRTGQAPQVLAAFRNLALSLLHLWRGPQVTAAREYYATHLGVLFRHLGLSQRRS